MVASAGVRLEDEARAAARSLRDRIVAALLADGSTVLVERSKIKRLALRSWVSVFRDREVVLRVHAIPDRAAAWCGIEDQIVASLQVR